MERRRFNGSQRAALYLYQDGKCAMCGCELEPGFHMDHIHPYSLGGTTDVTNGQALCPSCNLGKGNKVNNNIVLRDWQQTAFQSFITNNETDFLQVATPGAGKTIFGLYIARHLLDTGEVSRVIVVAPQSHLRRQWADDAHKLFGIQLDSRFANQGVLLANDYDGATVTYSSVARNPDLYRKMASDRSTLVIFDEIHHAGMKSSWGVGLRHAFSVARRRLSITGTPFRQDQNPIPFVRYDENGESIPGGLPYTYRNAIEDGVCRDITFRTFDGPLSWVGDDGEMTASFADELNQRQASERLRTAISTDVDWIRDVIRDADAKLMAVRDYEYPDAAGLVIAKDRWHAEALRKVVESVTGERPELVISDDPDDSNDEPSARIERFRQSSKPRWIVAVKMISEGVDIPRLSVLVYATNVTSRLFIIQAFGRIIRAIKGYEGIGAYVFAPSDPRIIEVINSMEKAIAAVTEERERQEREQSDSGEEYQSVFEAIFGRADSGQICIAGEWYTQDEVDVTRKAVPPKDLEKLGIEHYLPIIRAARGLMVTTGAAQPQVRQVRNEPSLEDRKAKLRGKLNRRAYAFHKKNDIEIKDVWRKVYRNTGGLRVAQAELPQLKDMYTFIQEWQEELDEQAAVGMEVEAAR